MMQFTFKEPQFPRREVPRRMASRKVIMEAVPPKPVERRGVHIVGDMETLPFHENAKMVISELADVSLASRIVLINPTQIQYNETIEGVDIVVVFTKAPKIDNLSNAKYVLVVEENTVPGRACFRIQNGVMYVSGDIAGTLAYSYLLDHKMDLNGLNAFKMEYICYPDIYSSWNIKPKYIDSVKLTELVDNRLDDTIEVEGSTLICACHFTTIKDVEDIRTRCNKLIEAINHDTIIYVYSISSTDEAFIRNYINIIANKHEIFIEDTKNVTRDAGKYLTALKSIKNVEAVFSNAGVITLFNDSVLMKDDLSSFADRYRKCISCNDLVGATSTIEKSFHVQSWFVTFNNKHVLQDYMDFMSIIRIDMTNVVDSIIDQMEVGICGFLSVKYKVGAVYPLHTVWSANVCGALNPQAKMLRTSLERCGFPFVKKRLVYQLKSRSSMNDLGVNLRAYS